MTDKELLELAARAAWVFPVLCYEAKRNCLRIGDRKSYSLWRPLTDDGDALRLAVKLSIHIEHAGQSAKKADRVQASPRGYGHLAWVEMYQGNPHAATRRAIVRAAAAIGEKL